jgi:hypothetical protein
MKRRVRKIEEKLERRAGGSQRPRFVVVYDPIMPAGPQSEAAIAEYWIKKNQVRSEVAEGFDVVYVVSEAAKQMTERILMGEGTEKSP